MTIQYPVGFYMSTEISSGLQVAVWTDVHLLHIHLLVCRLVHVQRDIFRPTGGCLDGCRPVTWPFSSLQFCTCPQGYLQSYRWPFGRLQACYMTVQQPADLHLSTGISSGLRVTRWTAVGLLRGHLVACRFARVHRDVFRTTGDRLDVCSPVTWPFSSLQICTCPQVYLQAYRLPVEQLSTCYIAIYYPAVLHVAV